MESPLIWSGMDLEFRKEKLKSFVWGSIYFRVSSE